MDLETQTQPEQKPTLIEMPEHMQAAMAATAATAEALSTAEDQEREAETAAIAQEINDTRPEGIAPTLPDSEYKPVNTELTPATVTSNPTFQYPSPTVK